MAKTVRAVEKRFFGEHVVEDASVKSLFGIPSGGSRSGAIRPITSHAGLIWGERVSAALLLAATGPALLLCAPILAFVYRSSPFVAHERLGKDGKPFRMLKLRTMAPSTGKREGNLLVEYLERDLSSAKKQRGDKRIRSGFAVWCRRYSLDELPQLVHVLTGKMSLVGPRPLTKPEFEEHYGSRAAEVLALRPGLSGLWQVRGRSSLSMEERLELDLALAGSLSLRFYIAILRESVGAVLTGRNAW